MYVGTLHRRKMTTEQMEKAKKDEKQVDKKKRKRKARESWKHFRHDDIELFKLGNVKEQQKPIYPKLQTEKQNFAQNVEKPITRNRLKSLVNSNQNNKSLEEICETLQNKVTESAKDDNNLTFPTNEESDKPGQLRVFLKQTKDSNEYEIVFNKTIEDNTDETPKSNTLEQPSLPPQCVGRHNLPIQITERRKSIAEPLTRINNQNSKISEDIIKPHSIKETIPPFINSSFLDNHKTDNESKQNPISAPLPTVISNKNTTIKDPNQQSIPTLLPLKGILQTSKTVDEPCNLSLSNRSPIHNNTNFWTSNPTTPKSVVFPESNVEKEENKCTPRKQPRKRACTGTKAKQQNVTQKEKNTIEPSMGIPPGPFQNGNFFPGQHTLPQLNSSLCLPQRHDEINCCRMNPLPQDTVSNNNPFEVYYRRLQAAQTKENPPHPFYPINPFIPPIPSIHFPYINSEENSTAEDYISRQRRTLEESFCQRPYLTKEQNFPHNLYPLPHPPVPPQVEQERMLLNSLDILNNYRSMNANNSAPLNPITERLNNQASINLMNSLQDKNNNQLSLFSPQFMHNFPIAPPRLNQFPTLESTNSNSNNLHHQEAPFLTNNNTKNNTCIPELFTKRNYSGNNFPAMKTPTPADVSLMHLLYRQDFSKPPPYSENPANPPSYSEAVKNSVFSKDQTQPTNLICGFLTPPSSSLDVLEISDEHDSSKRCVTSKPLQPTISNTSTSTTITDTNKAVIDFPTPIEEIPQPILKPKRYESTEEPISLTNLPRNSVIKANFSKLISNQSNDSSVEDKTQSNAANPKNVNEDDSKTEKNKKLKEISTQTDFSVDSISLTTGKDKNESIKTAKRKFSEETKDEILNKLMALSSNPMLTRRDENKINSNRCYENVTPVKFPEGNKSNESTTVISKTPITDKCSENVVVILEDSSNEAIMKNEEIILIEDSSDEAESETVVEDCLSEIKKSEIKVDNKNIESNSKLETLQSENADVSISILPPLNDSATLEPDEYVNEIKTLEKNETPSEFYEFYLFVTKKQILNNQKPISFKIFLEFQNAGTLKAMEEAYKIYMIKSEKEK